MKRILRLLEISLCCLFFLGRSFTLAIERPAPCLPLEPAPVTLDGTLRRQNFTNDALPSDQPEVYWVLHLRKSICVEKGDDEFLEQDVKSISKIQLVLKPDVHKTYQNVIDNVARVSGTLFAAHSTHHHTALLLSVDKIEKVSK